MPELLHVIQVIPVGKQNGLTVFNNMVRENRNIPNMKKEIHARINAV
jgi:hypothetical protein